MYGTGGNHTRLHFAKRNRAHASFLQIFLQLLIQKSVMNIFAGSAFRHFTYLQGVTHSFGSTMHYIKPLENVDLRSDHFAVLPLIVSRNNSFMKKIKFLVPNSKTKEDVRQTNMKTEINERCWHDTLST
jgi:hypothetical protein